jgi:hypothetical protein
VTRPASTSTGVSAATRAPRPEPRAAVDPPRPTPPTHRSSARSGVPANPSTPEPFERRRAPSALPRVALWAVVVGSGLVAAAAGCAPTGIPLWDAVLSAAFASVFVSAAHRAPGWALAPLLSPLVVLGGWVGAVVAASMGSGLLVVHRSWPDAPVQALARSLAAGVATGLMLRLPAVGPFGATAIVVSASLAPLAVVTAVGSLRDRARWGVAGAAVLAVMLSASVGVQLVRAHDEALRGSAAARRGLEGLHQGDQDRALRDLTEAAQLLHAADRRLGASWLEPLRLVPVVGPNFDAGSRVVATAADIAIHAAHATTADLGQVRGVGGAVDLGLVAGLRPALAALEDALVYGVTRLDGTDSPWVVRAVASQVDALRAEIELMAPNATLARSAVDALPRLLGRAEARRYLVMFGNPSEARELGGIMGSHLELTASGGKVRVTGAGSADTLNRRPPSTLSDLGRFPARFLINDPLRFSQNWTGMTDLATVAMAASELYPSRGGRPLDGVIYLDPRGIAALMSLTGPVEVPGVPYPLTAENVAQFLLVDQYREFDDHVERKDLLASIGAQTFTRLLSIELPGPAELGATLGPSVRGGHFRMETFDDVANDFLTRVGLSIPPPVSDGSDHLSVVHVNGAANKLDAFLHRTVDYDVHVDAERRALQATVTVELENRAHADLPAYVLGPPVAGVIGANLVQLSIYTPHALLGASVDGEPVGVEVQQESAGQRYLITTAVPPGSANRVTFDLSGTFSPRADRYELRLGHQPVVHPDQVRISLNVAGAGLSDSSPLRVAEGRAVFVTTLTEPTALTVELEPAPGQER